jgi:MFS family permease
MWFSFFVVATGVFMSTMDSSMVNIALPAIMDDFSMPLRNTEWVVMIYLLAITATLLFWGYLADRFGRRRIYAFGLFIFALGSLACALAPQLRWLVLARLGQALGAAMMMATGPAMVKEIFPADQLGRGLGLIGVAVSLGLMAGPAVSGFQPVGSCCLLGSPSDNSLGKWRGAWPYSAVVRPCSCHPTAPRYSVACKNNTWGQQLLCSQLPEIWECSWALPKPACSSLSSLTFTAAALICIIFRRPIPALSCWPCATPF